MRFSKSVLSQNLRTDCDLALYLTLFQPGELVAQSLPAPLNPRPGVKELRDAGHELELAVFNRISSAFRSRCVGQPPTAQQRSWPVSPLAQSLPQVQAGSPWLILQTSFELTATQQASILVDLGVSPDDVSLIPPISAFVPDILVIEAPDSSTQELLATGERRALRENESRRAIRVVDVKHAQEANPSYESEVVIYSMALAKWLEGTDFAESFFVSTSMALWTNGGVNRGAFTKATEAGETDATSLLAAVNEELEAVNVPIYVQAVRRFFNQRIPTILRQGNADWRTLDWHVGSRCASCDWLGYESWLSPSDRQVVEAHPDHYCFRRARDTDHISRLPLLTRGSRRVMESHGLSTVTAIAQTSGVEPVYGSHTRLRAERGTIPGFANALVQASTSTDPTRTDGMLARYADLDLFFSVNFDPGSGLLTGLGLRGFFRQHVPYGTANDEERLPHRWREKWIVSAKSTNAEQGVVLAFLSSVAAIFEHIEDPAPERGGVHALKTTAQFTFWERRQFDELCAAIGRHLPSILNPTNQRYVRALAWIFPPEELQPLADIDSRRPAIAFLRDSVRRLVRVPALHALTLFNVASHYHHGTEPIATPDNFYLEPLSDSIPRERIYEIWSLSGAGGGGTRNWGRVTKTMNQLIDGFGRTIDLQVMGLASITWRLRRDFADRLQAKAPRINLTIPSWARGVAQDSKLWIAWAKFQFALTGARKHLDFMTDPEEIEASHEGLRLSTLIRRNADGSLTYVVSQDSLNSKMRAGDGFLCVGVDAHPGFLALPIWAIVGHDAIPDDLANYSRVAMNSLFAVELVDFDRSAATATIKFEEPYSYDFRRLQTLALNHLASELETGLTLRPALSTDVQVKRLVNILTQVGNPAIAVPDPMSGPALGMGQRVARPGATPTTPIARVLWKGSELANLSVRTPAEGAVVASLAANFQELNESQIDAIGEAATKGLSVIWGPPGTGKTKTCAAFVHAAAFFETCNDDRDSTYAILVTANTYKAVEELLGRLLASLALDSETPCRIYNVYSVSRKARHAVPDPIPGHLEIVDVLPKPDDSAFERLAEDLHGRADRIVIVSAVTAQCARLAKTLAEWSNLGGALAQVFDLVLIDEASQVDVASATGPLALLKEVFQLVVVGDHLQMQPITPVPPPIGAEHLVGSIQTYLAHRFGISSMPLLVNYRSNADIVAYTRRLGYPSELSAAFPNTSISLHTDVAPMEESLRAAGLPTSQGWATVLAEGNAITAITYPDGMAGQANEFEAECVCALIWLLRYASRPGLLNHSVAPPEGDREDNEFWSRGIGVVTPHRAQRSQIVRRLQALFPATDAELIEASVDTVERFQGGQRETIIISFGVGDPDVIRGEEAFLMQLERTNVAISRAMGKCIVFVSDEIANHIPEDRKAAATAHALRGIVDEWCVNTLRCDVEREGATRPITVRWR